jgi:DNA polymerase-3 subunit gamma/tau
MVAKGAAMSAPPWADEPPLAEPDAAPAAPQFDDGPPPDLPPEALVDAGLSPAPGRPQAWESGALGAEPASAPPLGAQSAEPDPLADLWADVVAQLQNKGLITALVRELAVQSQCISHQIDGQVEHWRLRVERVSLMGDMHRDRLLQALASLSGRDVRLDVDQGAAVNTPAQRDLAARDARQRAAEALMAADPLVRRLVAEHPGARILPGSVRPL